MTDAFLGHEGSVPAAALGDTFATRSRAIDFHSIFVRTDGLAG